MSDEKDKVEVKIEGVDVSGYMPPGPVSPFPPGMGPGMGPGMPCPPMPGPDHMMNTLAHKLKCMIGQEVTVYVMGMSPTAPVPVMPVGGSIVPGAGPMGMTGILHAVGSDYIELHVIMTTMRVVYIPMMAIAAIVPGGPLFPNVEANTVTTMPETI